MKLYIIVLLIFILQFSMFTLCITQWIRLFALGKANILDQ